MNPSRRVQASPAPLCFGGFGRLAAGALLAGILAVSPGAGLAAPEVLEGGFRFFDPDMPGNRVASLLSLGPLVLGGARESAFPDDGETGICRDVVFVMLGSEGSNRNASSISLTQKAHIVAFFVFAECVGSEASCLQGASEPVAIPGCSATLKLQAKHRNEGSAKLVCKDGLPISDPDFGLTQQQQSWLAESFPGIDRKFQIAFKDRDAQETVGGNLEFKIRNLDVDALDDIVGTYLADDELPDCPD
jgi:hypothetical protein